MKKKRKKVLISFPKGRALKVEHTCLTSGPRLVLAIEIDQPVEYKLGRKMITHLPRHFRFKKAWPFKAVQHQTAGMLCSQKKLWIMELKPTQAVAKLMESVAAAYIDSCMGFAGVALSEIIKYNGMLEIYGLGCNRSHGDLAEAIYPIDVEHLQRATSTRLPKNLDDMLEFRCGIGRVLGSIGRWKLYILSENSD